MRFLKQLQVFSLILPLSLQAVPSPQIPIEILASTPELSDLAHQAFDLHGAFVIVPFGQASQSLEFTHNAPHQIKITITQSQENSSPYSQLVSASTFHEAALKAFDAAVFYLLGEPGFFAAKIAFVAEKDGKPDLYTSDLLLLESRQVTQDGVVCLTPRFSPDGQSLVFTTFANNGFPDIQILQLPTGERRTVASYTGTNLGGIFHPQGKALAMVLTSSGSAELYVADPEGGKPQRLTHNTAVESSPCWAPDGETLYFASDPTGQPQIFSIPAQGGPMTRLPITLSSYCAEPTVNPRFPHQIAFTAAYSGKFRIAVYNSHTAKAYYVTGPEDSFVEPAWAPDGRHLIATAKVGDSTRLELIDTLTHKKTPLLGASFDNMRMASFGGEEAF